jgi:hypothetical protein
MSEIQAGVNISEQVQSLPVKKTRPTLQNLKIVKPQGSEVKLPKLKKEVLEIENIDFPKTNRPKTATQQNTSRRPGTTQGKEQMQPEQRQPEQRQEEDKKQPEQSTTNLPKVVKPKQVVRKNTITQLNHVPFPQRKIIFSIDPGRVNFACRLEERRDDGTIEGLLFIKARFEELLDINKFFDRHYELLSQTTICIVEKQMSINYTMIRISQHVETYFLTKFPNVAVYEISAKLKVGKEETISTAKQILEKGKDETSVQLLEKLGNPQKQAGQRKPKKEKLDDLCDTVCQIEAFMDEMKRLEYKVPQGYVLQTKAGGKK